MSNNESYWYDVANAQVVRATERQDAWLGPFGTADEAEEAPQTFIAHARAFLDSEEGRRYLDLAKEEHPDIDTSWL
ncbi:hypothetical protein [Nocardioides sp.]|uniref:hypothetical protein n=1 Tax=Nocardioides sp. TaxID=35761 RepID=UPI002BF39861|nr:hypothetical protein [Nocardioides sp.]HSX66542.1 hypothetical protein [Nocardioides sp.]